VRQALRWVAPCSPPQCPTLDLPEGGVAAARHEDADALVGQEGLERLPHILKGEEPVVRLEPTLRSVPLVPVAETVTRDTRASQTLPPPRKPSFACGLLLGREPHTSMKVQVFS
jgi:hypothetical protein